ncbi:hypothetical protein [Streptomyces sp. CoT10]|uniref:hypothetical protein n=1 Tax=Streptomyces sp. CoT10 TaxID=2875762 RepID=UPI001CD1BCFF|nr:hypothetical protein [Streptomyces sp. CoT10]
MRTLLALILSWLMPAQGKRRAQHTPADSPTRRLIVTRNAVGVEQPTDRAPLPRRSPRPPMYLRGEDVALVRPYLIAHEREQERQRQRDRRTALALATLGIDFHGVTA